MDDIRPNTGESWEEYNRYLQEEGIVYEGEADPLVHVQNAIALPPRYSELSYGEESRMGESSEKRDYDLRCSHHRNLLELAFLRESGVLLFQRMDL